MAHFSKETTDPTYKEQTTEGQRWSNEKRKNMEEGIVCQTSFFGQFWLHLVLIINSSFFFLEVCGSFKN